MQRRGSLDEPRTAQGRRPMAIPRLGKQPRLNVQSLLSSIASWAFILHRKIAQISLSRGCNIIVAHSHRRQVGPVNQQVVDWKVRHGGRSSRHRIKGRSQDVDLVNHRSIHHFTAASRLATVLWVPLPSMPSTISSLHDFDGSYRNHLLPNVQNRRLIQRFCHSSQVGKIECSLACRDTAVLLKLMSMHYAHTLHYQDDVQKGPRQPIPLTMQGACQWSAPGEHR